MGSHHARVYAALTGACSLACPKEISFENIVKLNREFAKASITKRPAEKVEGGA